MGCALLRTGWLVAKLCVTYHCGGLVVGDRRKNAH